MKKIKLLQASVVLFVLNMAASILNYFCQLYLARVLSVESFGTINTIFSFMLIVAVPGTTLTMIVAKYYAGADGETKIAEKQAYIRKVIKGVSVLSICAFLLFLTLSIPLGRFLAIDNLLVLISAFILASLGFYHPLYSGVFSGNHYFLWVGVYSLFIPVYKILSIIVSNIVTKNDIRRLNIILTGMIIGTVITAFIGHIKMTSILGKISHAKNEKVGGLFTKNDFNTLILNICLMIYMNIDLLSVRYHEVNNESGLYSAVLLFGRIIYYFSTTLGTILLPVAANSKTTDAEKLKTLNKTLIALILFSLVCIVPIIIGKNFLLNLLYGAEYLGAAPYVKYVSVISITLSICTVLVNYLVGIGKTKFVTLTMLAVNSLIVLYAAFVKNISYILIGISVIGVIGMLIIYLFGVQRIRKINTIDEGGMGN